MRSPTLTSTGSPGVVCAVNGVFGKSIGLSGGVTCPSGSAWTVPAMSPTGTAYVGTTRRGSHTSIPRLVSTTVLPPSSARSRRGSSSRRSAPSSPSTTSRIRTLMSTVYSGSGLTGSVRCARPPAVGPCY